MKEKVTKFPVIRFIANKPYTQNPRRRPIRSLYVKKPTQCDINRAYCSQCILNTQCSIHIADIEGYFGVTVSR